MAGDERAGQRATVSWEGDISATGSITLLPRRIVSTLSKVI